MSGVPSEDKTFGVEGTGCWCPPERTLLQMRLMGHTEECAQARRGWRLNYAHLRGLDRERRVFEEVGRQLLASALTSDRDRAVASEKTVPAPSEGET